jgi:hypothetical protein
MKPVLLVYGNCQSLTYAVIAMGLTPITDHYEVRYLPSHPALGNTEPEPGLIGRCEVVWEQIGVHQQLPFRSDLPPNARSIRFPELSFALLWPLNCNDPRNVPEPGAQWGRYPYGDRLALQIMDEGLFGPAGYKAWVERGAAVIPDLHRLYDVEMARVRRRVGSVDLEPMNYILEHWKTKRLFSTLNHPSNAILWSVGMQLIEASLPSLSLADAELATFHTKFMNPVPGAGDIDMDWYQVVVHPFVAETFGLEWCTDDALHRCQVPGQDRPLTRAEFMSEYYMVPKTA